MLFVSVLLQHVRIKTKIKVITSEITENKVFHENEMSKKILSDCTVILLKQCYYRNCLVLTFVSNLVLLSSRHTSIHGFLFGVRELRTMMRDNLEEKLQLLFILGQTSVVLLDESNSMLCMIVDDHYLLHEGCRCLEVLQLQPGRGIIVEDAVLQAQLLEHKASKLPDMDRHKTRITALFSNDNLIGLIAVILI